MTMTMSPALTLSAAAVSGVRRTASPWMSARPRTARKAATLSVETSAGSSASTLSAISTDYGMLLAARVITSLNHGAFFGVGSIVAAGLVPPNRQAGAVAAMFMGLTIANVVGVPLATWAGDALGWRASFWGIAAIGVGVMAALRLTLPHGRVEASAGADE